MALILPVVPASPAWRDPASWDATTFHIYTLCEWHDWHFTRVSPLSVDDPRTLIAATAPFQVLRLRAGAVRQVC